MHQIEMTVRASWMHEVSQHAQECGTSEAHSMGRMKQLMRPRFPALREKVRIIRRVPTGRSR